MPSFRALLPALLGAVSCLAQVPQAPPRLSQTGLYGKSGALAPGVRPFAPQYPLWSDGATKARWILLPKGATIDASEEDAWRFPVGTRVWKEFAFGGRKVETRLMWRATDKDWVFASYHWNAAQTEADLVPAKGQPEVVEIAPGKRHSIPSVVDCKACHDNAGTELLGFTALQLSPDRDPGALHGEPLAPGMVTLEHLVAEGRLRGARKDLLTRPPRLPGDAQVRPLLGYLAANCGTCHRGDAPLPYLSLDLRPTAKAGDVGLRTTVGQRGQYLIPGEAAEGSLLIAPGDPALSSLVHRMASRNPEVQMPPLGTLIPDEAALARLRAWIRTLHPLPAPAPSTPSSTR